MADKVFLDSNVILYSLSSDQDKIRAAVSLLARRPTISVQVLNEVANVCTTKLRMAWDKTDLFLQEMRDLCRIMPLTIEAHENAVQLAQRYRLPFYDACIAASARAANCRVLYTEDLHHGLVVEDSLLIQNPFKR
ncbi:MAG TPA: PIN domain-containing protein [Bordetella sp.]